MYNRILHYISQYISLDRHQIEMFKSLSRCKTLRKRQFLVERGNICRYESFVVKGCLRTYYVDDSGKEHILRFAIEDWWTADLHSFLTQTPAHYSTDALEACELIQIEHENLQKLYLRVPKFERLFRLIFQNSVIASEERILSINSKDAMQRYLDFRERYPDIERRVPQYMIASYLGLSGKFLSKIRKRLANQGNTS